jgi:hypothetical protein
MSNRDWTERDDNGHLTSGDYSIWEQGTGIWYLDERVDYIGFIPVGQFKSLEEAKAAAGDE